MLFRISGTKNEDMTFTSSFRRILYNMGYFDYQQGLICRHLNQDEGWSGHETKCRQFILKALDLFKPEKVTVLGSGWLLELPLAEMAEQVNTIVLTDIVHPPEVKTQTSVMKNVKIAEEDVTGGLIREVWVKAGKRTLLNRLKSLDDIIVPEYVPFEDPGLVISLNILTQLETLPERLLRRKAKADENEFLDFRKKVQAKHLHFLQKHNSVLISDVAEVFMETGGRITENKTAVIDLPPGKAREEWTWDFDLKKADFNRKSSVMKVVALII